MDIIKDITRLSDREFFTSCTDISISEMYEASSAAERGDFSEARRIFAGYIRDNADWKNFAQKQRESLASSAEAMKKSAELVKGHTFVSCRVPYTFGEKIDWEYNPTYNGYKEWPWQLNRHSEWTTLASYYAASGDESAAAEWAEQFLGWAEQAQVPENDNGNKSVCWRTIEAGIRMMRWPYLIKVFSQSPSVSDEVITVFFKSIWEHGHQLSTFYTQRNWLVMEMHGLARIGFHFPFLRQSKEWLEFANRKLSDEINVQVYPDGMQYEMSVHYHQTCIGNYLDVLNMYRSEGKTPPEYLTRAILKMYEIYPKIVRPDFVCPSLNDGEGPNAAYSLRTAVSIFPDREDFRYIATNRAEGRSPDFNSVFCEYSGIVIMRSGWDERAYWAYMDGSPLGVGHRHDDKLNIQLYALGHELITEAGQFDYDNSEMRRYSVSTRGHNTSRIDNKDMNMRRFYKWNPEDIAKKSDTHWFPGETRDTAESDFDAGYCNFEEEMVFVKHTRRLIFLKNEQGLPQMYAVIDRFVPHDDESHSYELIWHMHDNPTLLAGNTVTNTYPDGVGITIASSDGYVSVVRGEKTPVYQGWLPNYGVGDVEHFPIPTVLNKGTVKNTRRIVTILAPFSDGKPFAASVEASPDIGDKTFTIVLADGHRVVVDE